MEEDKDNVDELEHLQLRLSRQEEMIGMLIKEKAEAETRFHVLKAEVRVIPPSVRQLTF